MNKNFSLRKYDEYTSALNQENLKKVKLTDISLNNYNVSKSSEARYTYKAEKSAYSSSPESVSQENKPIDSIYAQFKSKQHPDNFSRLSSFTSTGGDREERKESPKQGVIEEEDDEVPSYRVTEFKLPGLNLQKIEVAATPQEVLSKKRIGEISKIVVEPPAPTALPTQNKTRSTNKFKYYNQSDEEDEIEDVVSHDVPPPNFLSTIQTIKICHHDHDEEKEQMKIESTSPPKR